MPLSWMLSNFMLLVILLVVFVIYSAGYYDNFSHDKLKADDNFFVYLWW